MSKIFAYWEGDADIGSTTCAGKRSFAGIPVPRSFRAATWKRSLGRCRRNWRRPTSRIASIGSARNSFAASAGCGSIWTSSAGATFRPWLKSASRWITWAGRNGTAPAGWITSSPCAGFRGSAMCVGLCPPATQGTRPRRPLAGSQFNGRQSRPQERASLVPLDADSHAPCGPDQRTGFRVVLRGRRRRRRGNGHFSVLWFHDFHARTERMACAEAARRIAGRQLALGAPCCAADCRKVWKRDAIFAPILPTAPWPR